MLRVLRLGFKVASFGALGLVGCGIACLAVVEIPGACARFDEGAIQCSTPIFETVGGVGLLILLGSVFTGVPALLALAGVVFLVRDIVRGARNRA